MPRLPYDYTNEKHGLLTAIKDVGYKNGKRQWLCQCDCGNTTVIPSARFGLTLSCGCIQRTAVGTVNSLRKRRLASSSSEYKSWRAMQNRCYVPKTPNFENYGGRGIMVCDQWRGPDGFYTFMQDMGPRPVGHSLDRIDPNGNYTPENCRWADAKTQSQNRRNTPALMAAREKNLKGGRKHWPRRPK